VADTKTRGDRGNNGRNMKVLAVSVGTPREIEWQGRTVLTSIFKTPVTGRVRVDGLNIEGDRQSDLTVHGGRDKSVYGYPGEHYPPGAASFPMRTSPGAPSARTSRRKGCWRTRCASGTGIESEARS
jgi:hypothetical protein